MDSGESTEHHDPTPTKVRAPRLAAVQLNKDLVTNGLRTLFLREVEHAAPEVLEKLRAKVWPEYIKAYDATQRGGFTPTSVFGQSQWPALQQALAEWAEDVRLIHRGGPPRWVVQQVETTLEIWTRHPEWLSKGVHWFMGTAYRIPRRPEAFLIKLPQATWHWEHGYESARSAKKRIIAEVGELLDVRLAQMQKVIDELPRMPAKRERRHFIWTVLHQIKKTSFEDLAAQYNASSTTVKNAVMALKAEIGISLPKGRRKKK
jgi:hypothetical protein